MGVCRQPLARRSLLPEQNYAGKIPTTNTYDKVGTCRYRNFSCSEVRIIISGRRMCRMIAESKIQDLPCSDKIHSH